jgi:hypothetical protein
MPVPTPAEILQRRIELHHARGEKVAAARLAEQEPESSNWTLEQLEAGDRPAQAISDDPLDLSLQQLGLPMKLCDLFEQYGVLWVRQLVLWSDARLLLAPGLRGPTARRQVQQALARVGLSLCRPEPEELPAAPPRARPLVRKRSYFGAISPAKTRIVIKLLAAGVSQRQINLALGYSPSAHWAAWRVNQRLKQLLSAGQTATQVAEELGIESHSSSWEQVVDYLGRLQNKCVSNDARIPEQSPSAP